MLPKSWLPFLFSIFLCCVYDVYCYDDFCDEPHGTIYCSCDIKYMQTTMACYINADIKRQDQIWTDMSKVDNVVSLTLFSRDPAKLSEIPVESLQTMPYLEILKVQQANLSDLQSYAVSDMKYLRELILDGCEITALRQHAIANMPKLKELSMSDNLLEEILAESFTGLLELEKLFLDQNKISRIEACAFCDLQNLRELELWSNEITDLSDYTFRGLRYLKRLDVSKNKIGILNDKIFFALPKLQELDLSGNQIHHVVSTAFKGLNNIQSIYLQNNAIKVLPNKVFKSLPMLREVTLYKNELETFQTQLLENMNKKNDSSFLLDLKGNPLVCDCRLAWVKKHMESSTSHFFKSTLLHLECTTKEGKTELVHLLDMDCSKPVDKDLAMTTSESVILDLIPHEIQKSNQNNNSIKTTMSPQEVATEDAYVDQYTEMDNEDDEDPSMDSEPSSSGMLTAHVQVIVVLTLLTLFLVKKRKGTCL